VADKPRASPHPDLPGLACRVGELPSLALPAARNTWPLDYVYVT